MSPGNGKILSWPSLMGADKIAIRSCYSSSLHLGERVLQTLRPVFLGVTLAEFYQQRITTT
jgi:hypothetical protein